MRRAHYKRPTISHRHAFSAMGMTRGTDTGTGTGRKIRYSQTRCAGIVEGKGGSDGSAVTLKAVLALSTTASGRPRAAECLGAACYSTRDCCPVALATAGDEEETSTAA